MSVTSDAVIKAVDKVLEDINHRPLMDVLWSGGDHKENFKEHVEKHIRFLHIFVGDSWELNLRVEDVYPSVGWGDGFHDMHVYVGVRNTGRGLYETTNKLFIVQDVMMYNLFSPEKPWFENGKGVLHG